MTARASFRQADPDRRDSNWFITRQGEPLAGLAHNPEGSS